MIAPRPRYVAFLIIGSVIALGSGPALAQAGSPSTTSEAPPAAALATSPPAVSFPPTTGDTTTEAPSANTNGNTQQAAPHTLTAEPAALAPTPSKAATPSDVPVIQEQPIVPRPAAPPPRQPVAFYRLLPKSLPYDGGPPPQGYVVEHRSTRMLWIPGAATLLVSWSCTAIAGVTVGVEHLVIPLAGPWIDLAGRTNKTGQAIDITSGIVQGLGAGLLVAGLLIDEPPRFVRVDLAGVRVTPVVAGDLVGLRVNAEL